MTDDELIEAMFCAWIAHSGGARESMRAALAVVRQHDAERAASPDIEAKARELWHVVYVKSKAVEAVTTIAAALRAEREACAQEFARMARLMQGDDISNYGSGYNAACETIAEEIERRATPPAQAPRP